MSNDFYNRYNRNTLRHHGILGQKWGVRNGPPYPLSSSDHSASEKRAGWQKSLSNESTNGSNVSSVMNFTRRAQLDSMRKKYASIGDSGTSKSAVTKDAKVVAQKYGFSMKATPSTIGEDIKNTNPDWYSHQDDAQWRQNCSHSVLAFAARRRGLDVIATPISEQESSNRGVSTDVLCGRYFKEAFDEKTELKTVRFSNAVSAVSNFLVGTDITASGSRYERKASEEMGKTYENAPDGAYGFAMMPTRVGGHVFVWYKEDGAIKFADSQGGINAGLDFKNIARYGNPAVLLHTRVDNRELNEKTIGEAIMATSTKGKNHTMAHSEIGELHMDELYHYGILGMKWGVRRFQNKDGSLTAAGRSQYDKKIATQSKKLEDIKNSKGVLSRSYRATARDLYLTKQQAKLDKAKRAKNQVDILRAKEAVKDAKLYRRYGTGNYVAPNRDIYGKNLSKKELEAVKIKEFYDSNSIPRRIKANTVGLVAEHAKTTAMAVGAGAVVALLKKYGDSHPDSFGDTMAKGADFIANNMGLFRQILM